MLVVDVCICGRHVLHAQFGRLTLLAEFDHHVAQLVVVDFSTLAKCSHHPLQLLC
jgi:hypothetical protein